MTENSTSSAARDSWRITLRYLAAARYYLPEVLESADAVAAAAEYVRFLHVNELGLALDAAIDLGGLVGAAPEYWAELAFAADCMKLEAMAAELRSRTNV